MFSPFTSSSSSGSARAAASNDPDHLFVFDSLPLASSLMSDFEMGTALSSSAYALDAGSMSHHSGGHHQAFHAFAHDLSSSSGSDPESGSEDSPVHDDLMGSSSSGGSSALYGHAQPPVLFQLAPHTFSASAMAGDSQTFHLDDLPQLVPHPLSTTTPLGGAVLLLTPSSSNSSTASTATAAASTATSTTTTTRRRKKGSNSSSPPGSNHVSPTPVAHHLAHASTGMMPSVLSSASSSALAFSAATHLGHNNPFLSSTNPSAGTVSLMAAGAASASSAPSSASSKKASAAASSSTATTKRRKTTTKSKKDKDTSNDDDDLASSVSSSHTAGLDLSSAEGGVVSVPAQKLRKLKEDAELKRKRLDRKAELARNSRRKKKQRVVELEEQVAQLQAQLTDSHMRAKDIEAHCQILTMQTQNASAQIQAATQAASDALAQAAQASALHRTAQTQVEQLQTQLQQHARQSPTPGAALKPNDVAGLAAALAALSAPDVVINEALNQLRAAPATAGPAATQAGVGSLMKAVSDVTALTRHAMELMEKLLTPCMPVRVLRWALSQSDKFYADPNGLWSSLLRQDCGVTAQQMVALDDLRASFKAAAAKQHTSLAALYATTAASASASASAASTSPESASVSSAAPTDLCSSLLQAHRTQVESNEECLRTFATILTGEQMMKFLAWVERYGSVVVRINV